MVANAGAVARPQRMLKAPGRSSYEQQRPELLKEALELPNGMPVLPADLTFDAPSSLGVGNAGLAAGSSEQVQHPLRGFAGSHGNIWGRGNSLVQSNLCLTVGVLVGFGS